MTVSRSDMQYKIDNYLEEETKKALANDKTYQENMEKIHLYCRFFGVEPYGSMRDYEDYVLGWNCKYIPIEEIRTEYFWQLATIGEYESARHVEAAYRAEGEVQVWEKKKAKLEAKLNKPHVREKKAEKLRNMIEEGEKEQEINRKLVAAKNEVVALIDKDPDYFTKAAIQVKRAEEAAVKKIIADNTEKEEISELVFNVLDKYRASGESRYYRYGKEIVEEQQKRLEVQEKLDQEKQLKAEQQAKFDKLKESLTKSTESEVQTEDEREAE